MEKVVPKAGTVISTGNTEIDKKMGGGIPVYSLTLIEGQSDAGKSVLTQQMLWGSLVSGYRATIFTTENTIKSFVRQTESLSLDILDYFLLGKLRIYPIQTSRSEDSLDKLLTVLLQAIGKQKGQDLIIMDSLTSLISNTSSKKVISFFEECRNFCDTGMTIICVVHAYAFDAGTLIRIGSMCDAHLRLRLETMGQQLVKVLEVAKVRGADRNTGNIITFDVEPRWGMRVIPFSKAKA